MSFIADPWGAFDEGEQIGYRLGERRRNAEAYQEGGLEGVAEAAGRRGNLQTMMGARRFADEQHQQAFEWFEQNAPYARNVLRAARGMTDPQRRGAFLTQQRPRFEGMGFTGEQIDQAIAALTNPETAEEAFTQYDAAFSQHENPDWQIDPRSGQIGGIEPNTGEYVQGGRAPAGFGAEWRQATPEELQSWNVPPGTMVDVNATTGERRVRRNPPAGRSGVNDAAPPLPQGFQWED